MAQYLVPGGDVVDITASTLSGLRSLLLPSEMGDGPVLQIDASVTYPVSITEAATAVDTIDASLTFPVSITEAASASDTIDAMLVFPASITEAATASDAIDATVSYAVSLTEAATAIDSISGVASFSVSLLEAASAADTLTLGVTYAVSITEAADALDSIDAERFQPTFVQMSAVARNLSLTVRGVKRTRVVENVQVFVTRANQAARSASPVATLTSLPDGPFELVIPLTVSAGYLCSVQCVTTPAVASAIVTVP